MDDMGPWPFLLTATISFCPASRVRIRHSAEDERRKRVNSPKEDPARVANCFRPVGLDPAGRGPVGLDPARAAAVGYDLASHLQREEGRAVAKRIRKKGVQPSIMANYVQCSTWEGLRKNVFALCGVVPYVRGSALDLYARNVM